MNKKGISPLIGTVLLVAIVIAIVIAIVLLIMPWFQNLIGEQNEQEYDKEEEIYDEYIKVFDSESFLFDIFVFPICEDKVICYRTTRTSVPMNCFRDEDLVDKYCKEVKG